MQNIYNELTSQIRETNDKGEVVLRPPTALMNRAAKAIKSLADMNDNNMQIIKSLQLREQESMQELEQLRKEISDARSNEKPSSSDTTICAPESAESGSTV